MKTRFMYLLLAMACLLSSVNVYAYENPSDYDFVDVNGFCYYVESPSELTCSVVGCKQGYEPGMTLTTIPEKVTYRDKILTVTSIGENAFCGLIDLSYVRIPNSIISIKNNAFANCPNLKTVLIPNSVTSIVGAFSGCTSLTSINIPNSVTSIVGAFENCTGLTSINIPNSVTIIVDAFSGCTSLTSINIPNSVTNIDGAFSGCTSLTSINIPNSVTRIGRYTFMGCSSLISITIPNSVTVIDEYSFFGCENLKSLIIDDGENDIGFSNGLVGGPRTFIRCPIETIYIGRYLRPYESYYQAWDDKPFIAFKDHVRKIAFGKYITEIPDYMDDFDNIETITLYNPTPPNVKSRYFTHDDYINMNVYVPNGSLEAYQQADVWKNFWGLQEKDLAGIETVVADNSKTDNVIYDMLGRRLDAPKAGLNIINGKKVMIRK